MRIISYRDLAPGKFAKSVEKISAALTRGDFAAVGLKKLSPTPYWRAKLNDKARLLMHFAPRPGRNGLPVSGSDPESTPMKNPAFCVAP